MTGAVRRSVWMDGVPAEPETAVVLQIGIRGQWFAVRRVGLLEPPRGVERLRVRVQLRVAMDGPLDPVDIGACRDEKALVHVVLDELMGHSPGRDGPPAKGLLHDGADGRQIRDVSEGREPGIAYYEVNLVLQSALPLWVVHHGQREGHHCSGGGACAGLEERADDVGGFVVGQVVGVFLFQPGSGEGRGGGASGHLLADVVDALAEEGELLRVEDLGFLFEGGEGLGEFHEDRERVN